jgi:Zn-dependent protease
MMSSGLVNVVLLVPVFLFSLCLHEFAHAWVATWLGDESPRQAGRLTLHPMAHADLFGTLILPGVCIFYGLPFFGWAKPVPIDSRNFKNPRRDMALVAGAGPLSNLVLAGVSAAVLGVAVRTNLAAFSLEFSEPIQILSLVSIQVNLFLAIFNLLPLPPLDGFNVVQAVLPARWVGTLYKITPYSGLILLVLLMTGGLQLIGTPVGHLYRSLIELVT